MLANCESSWNLGYPDAIRRVVSVLTFVVLLNLLTLSTGHKAPAPLGNEYVMRYSTLIQGLSTNGTFEWINPYKYRNTYITSIAFVFRQNKTNKCSAMWIRPMW